MFLIISTLVYATINVEGILPTKPEQIDTLRRTNSWSVTCNWMAMKCERYLICHLEMWRRSSAEMQKENCHFAHTNHQRLPGYNFEIGDCKGSGLDVPKETHLQEI